MTDTAQWLRGILSRSASELEQAEAGLYEHVDEIDALGERLKDDPAQAAHLTEREVGLLLLPGRVFYLRRVRRFAQIELDALDDGTR